MAVPIQIELNIVLLDGLKGSIGMSLVVEE